MGKSKDISGMRFGRLIAQKQIGRRGRGALWFCLCDCGKTHEAVSSDLIRGSTSSCGCFRREVSSRNHMTHGQTNSRAWKAWRSMIDRCENENNKYFARYGGRGITVCERWKEFDKFVADMGQPAEGLSLDRIDNDSGYSPENCRWGTKKEQSVNRSITRFVEFMGVRKHVADWARDIGITASALAYRLKKMPLQDAMTKPVGRWV